MVSSEIARKSVLKPEIKVEDSSFWSLGVCMDGE